MQHNGITDADDLEGALAESSSSPLPEATASRTDQAPLPAGADEQLRFRAGQDTAERASDPPFTTLEPTKGRLAGGELSVPLSPTEAVQATGDPKIDGVLAYTKWSGSGPVSFSFPADPVIYGPNSTEAQNNFARVSDAVVQAASHVLVGLSAVSSNRAFLAGMAVSDITNLRFIDAGFGEADIRYAESSVPAIAYAYYPGPTPTDGDVWANGTVLAGTVNDLRTPELGSYSYTVVLHELLHTLGLKHSNETGGPANVAVPYEMDSTEFSVMSFRSYVGASPEGGVANERWGFPQSPMMLDIAGLQALYGANYGYRSGTTVYSWNPLTGEMSVDGVGQGVPGSGTRDANQVYLTVWDGGGDDTYDMAAFAGGVQIDLRPGKWSVTSEEQRAYIGGGQYARGTVFNALEYGSSSASLIENAVGGAGADILVGNDAQNRLIGNKGGDTLTGGAGGDTFLMAPGDGQDVVTDFASGSDKLVLSGVAAAQVTLAAATRGNSSGFLVTYGADDGVFLRGVTGLAGGDVVLDSGPLAIGKDLGTPTATVTTIGAGPDSLVLKVSQDAYQDGAQYTVAVDNLQIGGILTATALYGGDQPDIVNVLGDWVAGNHTAAITFLNDAWGGTAATDRNLYLDGATYNGMAVLGARTALYSAGPAGFSFTDNTPPPSDGAITVGAGPDALVLKLQQDAYQGDAQYTIAVDGAQTGGLLTASATRASGQFDTLMLRGDFAPGSHIAAVTFLNDAWGGTADTDRNLYVTGGTYNGVAVPGAEVALYKPGSVSFGFTDLVG